MVLTGEQIVNAMNALVAIGTRQTCLIPGMAKFALAKQHDRLLPTFTELMKKQQELVQMYGEELFSDPEKTKPTGQWGIKDEAKKIEYEKAWDAVTRVEFDIPLLTPVSLELIGNDPRGLEMKDFVLLGPLVKDPLVQGELFSEVK